MGNSPLVNYTKISPNKSSPRNQAIDTITIHCVVGQCSVETLGNIFAQTDRQVSSNYGIGYDGKIGMYVEEKDRSWCSSSGANDNRAITIEVASDTTHPYAVNDRAYVALINLLVDICQRNGIKELKWKADKNLIGQVDKQNMSVHRWFANKACPGDYLYNLHGQIATEVNAKLGVVVSPEAPEPVVSEPGDIIAGDLVCILAGATYYSGKAVPAWVKAKRWYVSSISGDRAVIDKSEDDKNSIRSPINVKYLSTSLTAELPAVETPIVTPAEPQPETATDTAKTIWDYLYAKLGNAYGVAGLMGNLYAESALRPNNLQNTCETKFGLSDSEYTSAVDNGSYANFVRDSAGYGLAQWTYWSRKQGLLNCAKEQGKSIGDLSMQLDFLWKELQSYSGVLSVLKTAFTVLAASNIVLTGYERPANQGDSVKKQRAAYGQKYYDLYAGKAPVVETPSVSEFKPYIVKVTASELNIRKGAGTNCAKVGCITDCGCYTIVEEKNGWGKLKSGVGWICLSYTRKL